MLLQPQGTRSGGSRGPRPASLHPRSHTSKTASSQGQTQSCPARHCYLPAAPGLPALLSTGCASNGKSQDSTDSHPLAERGDCRREIRALPAQGDQRAPVTTIIPSHSRAGCTGYNKPEASQYLSLQVHWCCCLYKAQQGSGPGSSLLTQCSSQLAPRSAHSTGLMGTAPGNPQESSITSAGP